MIYIELTDNYPTTYTISVPIKSKLVYDTYDIITAMYSSYPIDDVIEADENTNEIIYCGDSTEWIEEGDTANLVFVHSATYDDSLQFTTVPTYSNNLYAEFEITLYEKPKVGQYQLFVTVNNELYGHCLVRMVDNLPNKTEYENNREIEQYQNYEQ